MSEQSPESPGGDDARKATHRRTFVVGPRKTREPTGDPILDELWAMNVLEVQAIADDTADARSEKAQLILREMMKPLVQAMQDTVIPVFSGIDRQLAEWAQTASGPLNEFSRIAGTIPKLELDQLAWASSLKLDQMADQILSQSVRQPSGPPLTIDFRSDLPPDATAESVLDAAAASAEEARGFDRDLLRELVSQGAAKLKHDREQAGLAANREKHMDARHRDDHRVARSSAAGGWTAAALGVVSVVVTLWLGFAQLSVAGG